MILIGQYDSPFTRRVAIAMTRYGLAYEHRPWSVWSDADALGRINPLRRVPVLVLDDGTALVESFSILDTLDEMVGDRALLPASGPVRRDGLRIASLATGTADKAVALLYELVLRKPDQRNAIWLERCERQINETLQVLDDDRKARKTAWWVSDSLSHADIAAACMLRFVAEAHPKFYRAASFPALAAHAARCEALPEFQTIVQPLVVNV